jgi:hypothetical protein
MAIADSGELVNKYNAYYVNKYLPGHGLAGSGVEAGREVRGSDNNSNSKAVLEGKGKELLYMPGRFKDRIAFWKQIGAGDMVLDWIENGFMARFHRECPRMSRKNQESCYEPQEHLDFINDSVSQLRERGVIGEWNPEWGSPIVISPLKVVPKKGGLFRLILDLSFLNRSLMFPKFKYDNIRKFGEVFGVDYNLFAWDLKDGYWHTELHPNMYTYMCFEWGGKLYYFRMMPFGLAPACWVFTKIIRVLVDYWRSQGLACLSYIDDGIGGAKSKVEALFFRDLVIRTLVDSGWFINWVKSEWELSNRAEFIGYEVCTEGPLGSLRPSKSRVEKLELGVNRLLGSRTVTARAVAQVAGYIVSLRPVFDPMALMFTKYMYIWISRVSDDRGWDWRVPLEGEVREEIRVWKTWLVKWVSKSIWPESHPPVWVQAQDASDKGVGGWLGKLGSMVRELDDKGREHIVSFPRDVLEAVGRLDRWDQEQSSTYRELYALVFMIESFKNLIRDSSVLIQADNRALYYICSSGRTKVMVIHTLLVKLFWLCLDYKIGWDIVWLPRELNQHADDLSKFVDLDDWGLSRRSWNIVQDRFKGFNCIFTCDRFAAEDNRLLQCFCALYYSPGVWFVDCFSRSWGLGFSWWNPNPREVPRVLAKVRKDRARGGLLVPLWLGSWWWMKLCPDGRHFGDLVRGWFELERSTNLFIRGPSNCFWSREVPRTRILVLWLDGSEKQSFKVGRLGFCALGGCPDCLVRNCFL